jgi:RNA polymerase sigma factor (sigma-70 family)
LALISLTWVSTQFLVEPLLATRVEKEGKESHMAITSSSHTQDLTAALDEQAYFNLLKMVTQIMGENQQYAEDIVHDVLLEAWLEDGNFENADILAQLEPALAARCQCVMTEEALLVYFEKERAQEALWFATEQIVSVEEWTPSTLESAFQCLSDGDRQVLELRYIEGLPFKRTCAVLRVSPNALKKRMKKAVRALKQEMHEAIAVETWFKTALTTEYR